MQLVAITVSLALTAAGFALFGRALLRIHRFLRLGAPPPKACAPPPPGGAPPCWAGSSPPTPG